MGVRREVLEGKVFSSNNYGDFEVLEYLGNGGYTIKFIQTGTLSKAYKKEIRKGIVKDCKLPHKNYEYEGKKIEKLTILEVIKEDRYYALCHCDCGNIDTLKIRLDSIISGHTTSCGCAHKKYNSYNLTGNFGIGYTTKGEEFYFDLEDYNKIKDYCWCKHPKGYITTTDKNNKPKHISFHSLIMGESDNTLYNMIDHISIEDKHDNRKENLRWVNESKNQMNRKPFKNKKHKIKGIYYIKRLNKFEVRIRFENKAINIGVFKYLKDAIYNRVKYEIDLFGEYRYAWENDLTDEDIYNIEKEIKNT